MYNIKYIFCLFSFYWYFLLWKIIDYLVILRCSKICIHLANFLFFNTMILLLYRVSQKECLIAKLYCWGLKRMFAPYYETWYTYKGYEGWSMYQRNDLCVPSVHPTAPASPTNGALSIWAILRLKWLML